MELARRLAERSGGEPSDLWLLLEEELDDYLADPSAFTAVVAARRRQHQLLDERQPPFFFTGRQPPLEEWALKNSAMDPMQAGEAIIGLAGCPGIARGTARVVTNLADPSALEPGDVLIAPLTDPAWTPLFVPAEAVVVDVGAIMSHAVIVSRELGIPCVVSATDATKRIPDGATIEVDGTKGTVTVISI
jgi:pyruvate,water dikinase